MLPIYAAFGRYGLWPGASGGPQKFQTTTFGKI
jgi:hypothetical protein